MLNRNSAFKIRKNDRQLYHIFMNSMDAVVIINKWGTVLFVNPAAEAFWKREKEHFVGEQFGIPIEGNDRSDISVYRPDGEPGIAEMRVVEIEWEGEMVYLATFHDICYVQKIDNLKRALTRQTEELQMMNSQLDHEVKERILAEEKVQKREKLKGMLEMAGAVCHELNQPLQVLFGLSELLMMHDIADEEICNKINKIKFQVDRISDLTQKLMGITRYETKKYIGQTKIIDIENTKDRRSDQRYIPRKDKPVIIDFGAFKTDKIIDISRGGLAFWGGDTPPFSSITGKLSIIDSDNGIDIQKLPFSLLSKRKPVTYHPKKVAAKRRYRIRFVSLSDVQRSQLDQFLEQYTRI